LLSNGPYFSERNPDPVLAAPEAASMRASVYGQQG
jgi:hypothetical protein